MFNFACLLLVNVIYFLCFTFGANGTLYCRTPQNTLGNCTSIRYCSKLYNLLKVQSKIDENIAYIKAHHCDVFEERYPKVCCPLDDPEEISNKNSTTKVENKNSEAIHQSELLPGRDICGKQFTNRITGGVKADIGEFPWMALLKYKRDYNTADHFFCAGSLINNRYVLTAAHCIVGIPNAIKLIGVRLGEHDLSKRKDCSDDTPGLEHCSDDPIDFEIEEQIPHKRYNKRTYTNDIALLRLSKEVEFTDFISPICLPTEEVVEADVIVAGWGLTENRIKSSIKLKADVSVIPASECFTIYKQSSNRRIGRGHICATGKNGKDACRGDSGGPLMFVDRRITTENFVAVGIVSSGAECGNKIFPGVYTRVSTYTRWIRDNMKE